MASSAFQLRAVPFLLALSLGFSTCRSIPTDGNADENPSDPSDLAERAMSCFLDHNIYVRCQDSYRLNEKGSIDVPPEATDEFCHGPCLVETKLVLDCVEKKLQDFQFYNGATVLDVKYTLHTGCGHTSKRGDFTVKNDSEDSKVVPKTHPGAHLDYDDYFDHGSKLSVPVVYYLMLGLVLLLWS
ncbi:uncharacterized protein LOC141818214 [Curcuma longa]|uniref:uncharacterized protein LOC141818214 n=1 Tax=Curcuma longa TaxID=136217 RepID=UPI003D9DC64B